MHYVAYLDEFGHIGPFISREDPRHNTSPVFGLAGVLLPVHEVREFAIFYYQLKCQLLRWELESIEKNPDKIPPYQWEKKGSSLYTVKNINAYRELRQATNRLLNKVQSIGGYVFYTGEHKTTNHLEHNSTETFKRQLLQAVRKIDRFCSQNDSTFMLVLDEQDAGDEWREKNVEVCTLAMFEPNQDGKTRALIEPPIQAESHLFQTLQCADWICGLIGRLSAFAVSPIEYADWAIFKKYFFERVEDKLLPGSGLEHQKAFPMPAEEAGEVLPDATGTPAGESAEYPLS